MKSNNLYLFPALPNKNSGYEWAVKSDITQLEINKSDYVIFFATDESIKNYKENNIINKNVFFIPRKKSLKRSLYCIFTFQHPSFFLNTDWKKLPEEVRNKRYNNVFFGLQYFILFTG